MAYSTVLSATFAGLDVIPVEVEADVSNGLPLLHMVGYLSSEVKEAAERVRTAIRNSDMDLPAKKIVVNLSPATVRKRGASFDLPIALSILASLEEIPGDALEETMVLGEMGLDGNIRKVSGILPAVLKARECGLKLCIVPKENEPEAALVEGIRIYGAKSLAGVCDYLKEPERIRKKLELSKEGRLAYGQRQGNESPLDYGDICGQKALKRAVEIAVAGGHNILFVGPPGSSKSMIVSRIPSILPPLTLEESLEITKIYSILGMVDEENPLITSRPFRSVHHTITKAALIGGGAYPMPGEISKAHGGVLFLDELTEFQKSVLEVLRQPLEEKNIRLSRNHGSYSFPADFMLAAAMNPCPCGNFPDAARCTCTPGQINHYLGRVSQPFLDRIDICMEAPRVDYETLRGKNKEESSALIRERVVAARNIQRKRYENLGIYTNGALDAKNIESFCRLGEKEEKIMKQAYESLGLTARTYHKILKVARTIADLSGSGDILEEHLMEAMGYRTMDKKYWGR